MKGIKSDDRGHFVTSGGKAPKASPKHRMVNGGGGKQGVTKVAPAARVGVSKMGGK